MTTAPVYRFDRFVLNVGRGCLQDDHIDLELRRKSFEVLCLLVQNAGRLVSKDELLNAVWSNVTVSEDAVAHCIRDIRKVLDDRDGLFIKTVPRRGYMFVADVMDAKDTAPSADDQPRAAPPNPVRFEENYRALLTRHYSKDAEYFVPLAGATQEVVPTDNSGTYRSTSRRRARPEYHEWLPTGEEIRRISLDSLREAVVRYPCVILLGDPGCGKTSALENLAFELASDTQLLPVPLYLGDLSARDRLEDFMVRGWTALLAEAGVEEVPHARSIFDRYLESGRLVFLLDALNEMPLDGYRERCLALRRFIDRSSSLGNRFIVSCRVLDYGEELSGLQRVEIQPLNDEKVRQFVVNELPNDWETLWRELNRTSDQARRLLEIARNPYMLTVMIDVFTADGHLIQNRAELMRRFMGILMGWAGAKIATGGPVNIEAHSAALSVMAFEMQRRSGFGTRSNTEDVIAIAPRLAISPVWPAQECQPDQVLSFASSAGIIDMSADRKTVRFYHQLLQEFLAATHMLRLEPAQLVDLWRWPWLEDEMPLWVRPNNNFEQLPPPPPTRWEETTLLAAGLLEANDDRLIALLTEVNPVLAARCAAEHPASIRPTMRDQIVDALRAAISNSSVALRVRVAAGDALGALGDPRVGEMVVVPAGQFRMGEGDEEHQVFLPQYRIARYPVTNAEYARFLKAGAHSDRAFWTAAGWQEVGKDYKEPRLWQNSRFNKPNQPVIGLSWYECIAYCRWLSHETGSIWRLPTEAEWEKAARGEDGRIYPWGSAFDASRLNAREGNQKVYCTTPIGIYPLGASPFGLLDSAGNGWEWCATRWKKPFPYDAAQEEWDEDYLEGRNLRALRGGSWNYEAEATRCAHRFRFEPFGWNDRGGFRIVCG